MEGQNLLAMVVDISGWGTGCSTVPYGNPNTTEKATGLEKAVKPVRSVRVFTFAVRLPSGEGIVTLAVMLCPPHRVTLCVCVCRAAVIC